VRVRRNVLRRIIKGEADAPGDWGPVTDAEKKLGGVRDRGMSTVQGEEGWRFRTVIVTNLPPVLRNESALREFFEESLRPSPSLPASPESLGDPESSPSPSYGGKNDTPLDTDYELITSIILVRKQSELNELFAKYRECQHQLETAHCRLAENAMEWVAAKVKAETKGSNAVPRNRYKLSNPFGAKALETNEDEEKEAREGDSILLSTLRDFLPSSPHPLEAQGFPKSLWTALRSLDPLLLDRFQPLYKLHHFRGARVPANDYWLAKLNLTMLLLEEKRSRPDAFTSASSAFVTFERVGDARRARREIRLRKGQKVFSVECKVRPAPEVSCRGLGRGEQY
jgi:hypothetical protein